jgi:chemotaxis protein histidine kinase CheA
MTSPAPSRFFSDGATPGGEPSPGALRLKVGSRFGGLNAGAVAKAEAALKSLSSQFAQWMQDELTKLEIARSAIHSQGLTQQTADQLYTHAHDLKGLGATYEFPIVTRIAGSLCKAIETPDLRLKAPVELLDAHVDAIKAAVRDDVRDENSPQGRGLSDPLERAVAAYIASDKGSTTAP